MKRIIPMMALALFAGCEGKAPTPSDCATVYPLARLVGNWKMNEFTVSWNNGGSHSFTGSDLSSLPMSTLTISWSTFSNLSGGTYTDLQGAGKVRTSFNFDTLSFTPSDTALLPIAYKSSIGCGVLSFATEFIAVNPETNNPTPQQHQIELQAEEWINKTSVNFSTLRNVQLIMNFKLQ